ncbi:MAG: phytanoyl-CoA dioxygenase family protein [Roseiflexaceae bacterium]|nr:phytanoyl-CoA dioxygenase family protein [Roseiflexaceae bacterium]
MATILRKGTSVIAAQQQAFYDQNGYVVASGLFTPAETARFREHFTTLRENGQIYPGDDAGIDSTSTDPLRRYPRMIQMHRWDAIGLEFLLDQRIGAWLTGLVGVEPLAVQTMLYFKPAGARGQALHQDNYYLRVQPGTCMAAWLSLDACDEANGCMQVVPGSHTWPTLCSVKADTSQSFTDVTVPIPAGTPVVPVTMQPGDVLFFNGQIVHGSFPNTTADRFRRALIGHYIHAEADKVANWYHPVLRLDGSEVTVDASENGTRCGVWIEQNGQPAIEVNAYEVIGKGRE